MVCDVRVHHGALAVQMESWSNKQIFPASISGRADEPLADAKIRLGHGYMNRDVKITLKAIKPLGIYFTLGALM